MITFILGFFLSTLYEFWLPDTTYSKSLQLTGSPEGRVQGMKGMYDWSKTHTKQVWGKEDIKLPTQLVQMTLDCIETKSKSGVWAQPSHSPLDRWRTCRYKWCLVHVDDQYVSKDIAFHFVTLFTL